MSRFQLPDEFFQTFIAQVDQARRSVYLQSLTFESGRVMDIVAPALIRAAQRGVQVEIHVDWLAKDYVHGKIALTPRFSPSQRRYAAELHRRNHHITEQLRQAGVVITFVNKPDWLAKIISVAGRNHMKLYMVDEKIVWLGGVNVLDAAVDHLDFMVSYTDQTLIQALKRAFFRNKLQDEVVTFGEDSSLLIDGGKRGKSIIYEHALGLIDQAEREIVFISQFVPERKLLKALVTRAKEGCQVTIMTSPKTLMQFSQWPYKLTYLHCRRELKKVNVVIHHLPEKVHCKLLLVDGREAIFGSHNLVETGIRLGTAEVGIQTTEPELISHLVRFIHPLSSL